MENPCKQCIVYPICNAKLRFGIIGRLKALDELYRTKQALAGQYNLSEDVRRAVAFETIPLCNTCTILSDYHCDLLNSYKNSYMDRRVAYMIETFKLDKLDIPEYMAKELSDTKEAWL